MHEETKKLAIQLRDKILSVSKYSNSTSNQEVIFIGEEINGLLTYLVSHLAEAETAYRRTVTKAKTEGESMAAAEAIGKASDEYQNFRKLELLYERGHEAFVHTKKLMDALNAESKRT